MEYRTLMHSYLCEQLSHCHADRNEEYAFTIDAYGVRMATMQEESAYKNTPFDVSDLLGARLGYLVEYDTLNNLMWRVIVCGEIEEGGLPSLACKKLLAWLNRYAPLA